ncbi:hypothetical protein L1987_12022 [Smallanthus sonchifolius]|uniref:Uncharacterized protein n=1 Tax=Smallanthus sonchifolius TaxID=185202 RepID=A0ACB9JD34_9ASTR|nr:hypothetical protein L1987_12022 [Smallanthus sonchifolius]
MRIFHVEEENKAQTSRVIRDCKISSRRTRSSKGDNRKGQNWGRRQLSHEISSDNDKMEGEEFRTAVAAAAFAINFMENKEQEIKDDLNSTSKKSFSEVPPSPKTNGDLPSEANQPKPTVAKSKSDEKTSVKTIGPTSLVEKTPNFVANKQVDEETSQKEPESRLGESDIWEKTQMEKTKERFMKVNARIFEWENKKKWKAKNKLIRKEGKLEWKRARALQDFKRKMETVEKISRGARFKNEENQKREEIKVKEKTSMIRSRGKIQKPMFLCC